MTAALSVNIHWAPTSAVPYALSGAFPVLQQFNPCIQWVWAELPWAAASPFSNHLGPQSFRLDRSGGGFYLRDPSLRWS